LPIAGRLETTSDVPVEAVAHNPPVDTEVVHIDSVGIDSGGTWCYICGIGSATVQSPVGNVEYNALRR
jgi:hypothetical protein